MKSIQSLSSFSKALLFCILVSSSLLTSQGCNLGVGNLGFGNIGVGNIGIGNKGFLNSGVKNIGFFNRKSVRTIGFANKLCVNQIGFLCFIGAPNLTPYGRRKK